MANQNLEEYRQRIDMLNNKILELLNERTEVVKLIGIEKEKQGKKIHDPIRETKIIEALTKKNEGPMTEEMVSQIFKEIFKMSVQFQEDQSFINKANK